MDIINDIIAGLDKHAAKQYKVFARRADDSGERKDLLLFDMIRKADGELDEEKALRKLYDAEDKNAFYRLKNRLAEDVSASIFLHHHKNDGQMLSHYWVALGNHFFGLNKPKVAAYYFRKAEKKARETENFGLLDIIYSYLIKLAREIGSINPESYIKLRKENRDRLNKLSEVEDILEAFEYRVKISQNLTRSGPTLQDLLKDTMAEYLQDDDLKNSPRIAFGTYFIISRTLLQQNDFRSLEDYLINTYSDFEKRGLFGKGNHQQKLQMLAWIANAAFKNKNYKLSLEYAARLLEEMERYDRLYYSSFEFYYYNILVINYSAVNPLKAIEVLLQMAGKESIEKHSFNEVFIYFNLALLYFQQREYQKAISYLHKLYTHWGYPTMDEQTRISAYIGELMMRYELHEWDMISYRVKQIFKDTKGILDKEEMKSERAFLELLPQLVEKREKGNKREAAGLIRTFLEKSVSNEQEEFSLFGYKSWICKLL
jgi:hypothetical protein